ncbi:White collar 1 protein [Penicillium alfredii]|uniref:White collar 1 protein n=1 Tax=Penicillium alfredii TaxID=1506179 RepID=A0A9W9G9T5_9EURO|nr:White collar 1 protein [Penicillium alfredii]KAJ5114627.1 White collar 1 protein [Penicillium alfredii]
MALNGFTLDYPASSRDEDHNPGVSAHIPPPLTSQESPYMGFATPHVGNYAFNMLPEGSLPLQNFDRPEPQPDLEGRMSNVMLAYDSMPMNLDASNAFAYDGSATYPATSMGITSQIDPAQFHPTYPSFPQSMPINQYPQQTGVPPGLKELYTTGTNSTNSFEDSDFSRASDPSQVKPHAARFQGRQGLQQTAPAAPRAPQPVPIQPKKPVAPRVADLSPGLVKPDTAKSEHTGIYSSSGFDVLGVLSLTSDQGRVAMRPNPKINIGAVDLSCAFVLCDILREDHPIVYVSEAFERLTGYTKDEIVGQNCRFLQGPDGKIDPGMQRSFVDGQTVYRLRSTIDDRSEIQASLINYRKGGQPFMNLITMIPIQWDSAEYRFYVGFQVDLVEKPDAVTRRNPGRLFGPCLRRALSLICLLRIDGTYSINYQRDQLPQYVVPPPDVYRVRPDLATQFSHDEVTAILNAAGAPGPEVSRQYLDRILVENSDDVIHVLSFNGEFLYLSPSCHRILEYEPAELIGKTLSSICHPSDIGPVIRDLRASTTPSPVSVVYRIRQKYRGYIWVESHGAWHIDPNQGRQYLVMTGRPRPVYSLDQVARLGSSAALAENDIWAKVSLSGVILFVTSKVKPVLGRSPDDLIGKGLQELMDPEMGPRAITQALEAAARGQNPGNGPGRSSTGEPPSFRHQMRHKKGHTLSAHTTLYTGDSSHGTKPSFFVAQIRFARSIPPSNTAAATAEDQDLASVPGSARNATLTTEDANPPRQYGALGQRMPDFSTIIGLNGLPTGNRSLSPSANPATLFTELNPTRGSSWQIELRELEKQNRGLSDELQRLLSRRKKRKRKQSTISIDKACAVCGTKNTPEWRRGPSGNRDLCNSCGLRWAKQVRGQAQAAASAGDGNGARDV